MQCWASSHQVSGLKHIITINEKAFSRIIFSNTKPVPTDVSRQRFERA